jgi:hypothetical protein
MSGLWSRGEYQGWPTKWPVSSLGALLIAVAVGIGIFTYRNAVLWTPLQRWYWDQYLSAQLMPMKANSPNSNYRLLAKVDRHGKQQLALDADVVPGPRQGRQLIPFTLSSQARQAGAADLVVDPVHYSSQQVQKTLSDWIYDGQTPDDLVRPAWIGGLGVLVLGLVLAIPRDRARARILQHGRRLKGPQMVTVKEFNQWSGGSGIGFVTTKKKQILSIPRSFGE